MTCQCVPCPDELMPVQGADGRFYRHPCWAKLAGNESWVEVSVYAYTTATLGHRAPESQVMRCEAQLAPFGNQGMGGIRGPASGNLGTGAVVRPDPTSAYQAWAKASPSASKASWIEHAKRLGMDPEDMESGWAATHPSPKLKEAIQQLRTVLGEMTTAGYSVAGGYSVPNPLMVKTPQGGGGDTGGGGGFPFRTRAAERVWRKALDYLPTMEKATPTQVIDRVLEDESIPAYELTPEDMATLEIAINWAQAGKITRPGPPLVGTKGGGQGKEGHTLAGKGDL